MPGLHSPTGWALAAVAGVSLQLQQPALWPVWSYAAAGIAAVLLWLGAGNVIGLLVGRARSMRGDKLAAAHGVELPYQHQALKLLACAVIAFALAGWQASQRQAQRIHPALEGMDVQVVAVVDAMPTRTTQGLRLRLAVEHAQLDEKTIALPQLLDVTWYAARSLQAAQLPEIHAGERWRFTLRLKAPHGARNPHGWDWELWLWAQGVGATGYVRDGANQPPPTRLDTSEFRRPVEALRQQVRDAILKQGAVHKAQAEPASSSSARQSDELRERQRAFGVVAALVTGDQRAIDTADWDVFRRTGVAHLVSISGLHITLFAWLAVALLGALWRRSGRLCLWWPAPLAAMWCGVALAAAYALFSGWGLPAQRTVGMLLVVTLLRSGGWRWPWWAVWSITLAVIALWDPWALCQAGFWLSFVAVGVLLASGPPIANGHGAMARVRQLLREQMVVVLALSPLSLLFFGQVSLVGALANLLAIPWVTLVVTPMSLLGVVFTPLWELAAWCVQGMVWVLEFMSAWPWASISRAQAPWWAAAAAIAGGIGLVLPLPWQWRLLALPLLWPALWWQAPRPAWGEVELLALDVGQGSAVLLRTASHSLLFDAGPAWPGGDAGARVVQPLLQAMGERLDVLLLSHGDNDHVGGADAVLAQHPQAQLMGAGAEAVAQRRSRPWQPCVAGQQWTWDGVQLQVLHPAAGAQGESNAASCVLRVQAATGGAALLTGDIEAAQEAALLRDATKLPSHLLLVPHHGSRTSSSAAFLAAVAPQLAVVQAGYRNRFGHPAAVVLQRYAAQGTTVVTTSQCGAVHWISAQPNQLKCERQLRRHYWGAAPSR